MKRSPFAPLFVALAFFLLTFSSLAQDAPVPTRPACVLPWGGTNTVNEPINGIIHVDDKPVFITDKINLKPVLNSMGIASVAINPDGNNLAYATKVDPSLLVTIDLRTGEIKKARVSGPVKDIYSFEDAIVARTGDSIDVFTWRSNRIFIDVTLSDIQAIGGGRFIGITATGQLRYLDLTKAMELNTLYVAGSSLCLGRPWEADHQQGTPSGIQMSNGHLYAWYGTEWVTWNVYDFTNGE